MQIRFKKTEIVVWTAGNGDLLYEVCIPHRINPAREHKGDTGG